MNEQDSCKLDVYPPSRELVLDCLTSRITAKELLQTNASMLWQWNLNVFGHLAGLTEEWDQEWASNIQPKLELLTTRLGATK